VLLTLPILEVIPATPRSRIVRIDLRGHAFPYDAGQALLLASHGREPRKAYSIAASPQDAARDGWLELLIGVDREGQAGPHLQLESGARVDIEGPLGRFTFPADPQERRFLFVAGGTGIAPLRAMVRECLLRGYVNVSLLYSGRAPGDFAYETELRELAAQGGIELLMTVTRDAASEWMGTRGRIGPELLEPLLHDRATLCFICGPRTLVDDMPRHLMELGVDSRRILIEEW
jgi:ferredoxin-NADP reductase